MPKKSSSKQVKTRAPAATDGTAVWLPIATSPKDGTKIVAFRHHSRTEYLGGLKFKKEEWDQIVVAYWYVLTRTKEVKVGKGLFKKVEVKDMEGWMAGWNHYMPSWMEPTHWMPIPPLPN